MSRLLEDGRRLGAASDARRRPATDVRFVAAAWPIRSRASASGVRLASARAPCGSRHGSSSPPSGFDTLRRRPRRSSRARPTVLVRCSARSAAATNRPYMRQCCHCSFVTRQLVSGSFSSFRRCFLCALLPEMHPELEDERAVVGQRALEAGDPIELLVEVGASASAVDAIEHRAADTTSSGTGRCGPFAAGRASSASTPGARSPRPTARRRRA